MARGKSKSTLTTEDAILDIVAERAPITVRGVCYALFVAGLIRSMATKETQRISRIMTDMRETGALDWTLIVDGSRAVERINQWRDPSAIVDAAVRQYRRNNWQDQPTVIEVWAEKATIQGVLAPVLDEYGVTFRVMKGFSSFTTVRQAAEDSLNLQDQKGIVLYLGDFDPSGLYMSEVDLPARLGRYGSIWTFKRIAITSKDAIDLPSFDAHDKSSDSRFEWFVEHYGRNCWELDAMNPNDLRQRVREQIETRLDLLTWQRAIEIEHAEVQSMRNFASAWQQSISGQASK